MLTFDPNMRDRLKRNMFDITSCEFDSSERNFNQIMGGGEFGDEEIDSDYAWLFSFLTETIDQTKSSSEEVIAEDENEDKDPQYCMFLKELTENGKSYKLKISKNDEAPKFLEYEQQENSDGYEFPTYTNIISIGKANSPKDVGDRQINQRVKKREISTTKEVSRKKKIKECKSITDPVDSCYRMFLDGCIRSEYGAFICDGQRVKYEEEKATSSDSDILIWDNLQDCNEVNNKKLMTAKKDPSLKEKLMRILRQPYNHEEYKKLSEEVEREKPICRALDLRYRSISSALDGKTKSMLDDGPTSFRMKLRAAKNDRPRALNLLRMFNFWLQHVPNEEVFQPWLNEDCLKVLPSTRR